MIRNFFLGRITEYFDNSNISNIIEYFDDPRQFRIVQVRFRCRQHGQTWTIILF